MRIDRLLGITICLLNHGIVSTKTLAERFEVTMRTIQRDITSLCLAGIPVSSTYGPNGGHAISEDFGIDRSLVNPEDRTQIITALRGLCSAYGGKNADKTLEKLLATASNRYEQPLIFDLSAAREGRNIDAHIALLEQAIAQRRAVEVEYHNAHGDASLRTIEPLLLIYQWYAWYVFGYCRAKEDYRLFKLARIASLRITDSMAAEHGDPHELLSLRRDHERRDGYEVRLLCRAEARFAVLEYLNGRIAEERENGDFIYEVHVLEDERMWFSLLLGFGRQVVVLEPEALRARVTACAEGLLEAYAALERAYALPPSACGPPPPSTREAYGTEDNQ